MYGSLIILPIFYQYRLDAYRYDHRLEKVKFSNSMLLLSFRLLKLKCLTADD